MKQRRGIISILMSIVLVLSVFPVYAHEDKQAEAAVAYNTKAYTLNELRKDYGALTVELYNIGAGYLLEPTLYEKNVDESGKASRCVMDITKDALDEKNISYNESSGYVSGFGGDDSRKADWPWYFYEEDDYGDEVLNAMAEKCGGNLFTQQMRDDLIFDLAAVNDYYGPLMNEASGKAEGSFKNETAYKNAYNAAISPTVSKSRITQVQTALESYITTAITKIDEYHVKVQKAAQKAAAKSTTYTELKDYAVSSIKKSVTNPAVGSVGGEWAVLTLGKAGEASSDFKTKYRASVKAAVEKSTDGKLDKNKATDNERVMIGLSAIGDSVIVNGVDLAAPLYDVSYTTKQGINGAIFGLIALDMSGYNKQNESENQTSASDSVSVRDDLIRHILGKEISGGGWSIMGGSADPDITFMAIQALAPYYNKDTSVKASVDRALTVMSSKQDSDGGFSTSLSGTMTATSESVAQAITGLASLGIDPRTDSRFIKNDNTLVDNLLTYKVTDGYAHSGTTYNQMATEQASYASVSLWLLEKGKHLYDRVGDIVRPTASPAPTATPKATPTATPSATPTATPTGTPSATPSTSPAPTTHPIFSPPPSKAPETKSGGVTYQTDKSGGAKVADLPNKKTVTIASTVKINGKNRKVTVLSAGACKGLTKTKTIKITTKTLKKVEKGALSGLNKNAVICLPKKKFKYYVKLIKKKGTGYKKTMKFKKI